MPKLLWRLYAGIEMAPICRNFTNGLSANKGFRRINFLKAKSVMLSTFLKLMLSHA